MAKKRVRKRRIANTNLILRHFASREKERGRICGNVRCDVAGAFLFPLPPTTSQITGSLGSMFRRNCFQNLWHLTQFLSVCSFHLFFTPLEDSKLFCNLYQDLFQRGRGEGVTLCHTQCTYMVHCRCLVLK